MMSDAERQAHAAKEFDEAAAIRRAGPQPAEDLEAIVTAIDEAIERGWDLTLQLQISHNWATIRAALERLSQREDVIARLDREVEGHIELVVETQRSRDAALARERELREALAGWHRPKMAKTQALRAVMSGGDPCRCVGCEDISRARNKVLAQPAAGKEKERG